MLDVSNGSIISAIVMNCTVNQDQRLLHNILESIIEFLKLDKLMGWDKTENSLAYRIE